MNVFRFANLACPSSFSISRSVCLALTVLCFLSLIACGLTSPPQELPTYATDRPISGSNQSEWGCVPASQAQIDLIRRGLKDPQTNDLIDIWAVKDYDHINSYYVAAYITGTTFTRHQGTGIWAVVGSLENPTGEVWALGQGIEYTDWPDGTQAEVAFSVVAQNT